MDKTNRYSQTWNMIPLTMYDNHAMSKSVEQAKGKPVNH